MTDSPYIDIGRPKKRNKYGARRTVLDGITFHSAREAKRYADLKLLERGGKISGLDLQPKFPLRAAGSGEVVGHYIADFSYTDLATRKPIVEDCKGFRTDLYKWKAKHFKLQYPGYELVET